MIQLTEADRAQILRYVGREPEVNIFFIGDVENFGVDCSEVSVWASEKNGIWDSLILRYFDDYVIYSQNADYDADKAAAFLTSRNVGMISGKTDVVTPLKDFFPERQLRSTIMTKCTRVKTDNVAPGDIDIRNLTPDDAEEAVDLMMQIEEFRKSYEDRAASVSKLKTSLTCGGSGCGAYLNGTLVSCAQTGAENSMCAMVVGVATRPDVRGRGYASAVVSRLCTASFHGGKKFLCLFYDNPVAGRIYNRIGFEPFGEYALFR